MTAQTNRTTVRGSALASAVLAGACYFVFVFSLGFVLGTLRTFLVPDVPGSRRLLGVLIELPIMLTASWMICRLVIARVAVPPDMSMRAVMGGVAFALLIVAETLVGILLFGRTPGAQFALYGDASYALGLLAQIAFALMPVLCARFPKRPISPTASPYAEPRPIRRCSPRTARWTR